MDEKQLTICLQPDSSGPSGAEATAKAIKYIKENDWDVQSIQDEWNDGIAE